VLAVTTPDCGRWAGASGQSTSGVALEPTDVFRIGSITKTFVATAVLTLADHGAIALTDPLEKWLPGFPNGANVTLRELLNHTSGVFDYTADSTFQQTVAQNPATVWKPQQLVDLAASHPPYFAPGKGWQYSNTDYILLGMMLEKVTGQRAGRVLHQDGIDVASLHFTTLDGYEPITGTLAHGYSTTGTDVTTLFDPSYAWTAGAMVASPGDLADWAVALYGGSVLSKAALALMLDAVDTGTPGEHYGLGVFVWDASVVGGTVGWGHPGDISGYHSQLLYLPAKKTAIVSIVNSDAADPNGVTVAALNLLLP
jgi:D-alanyl-D-alanine carboxypeptidase